MSLTLLRCTVPRASLVSIEVSTSASGLFVELRMWCAEQLLSSLVLRAAAAQAAADDLLEATRKGYLHWMAMWGDEAQSLHLPIPADPHAFASALRDAATRVHDARLAIRVVPAAPAAQLIPAVSVAHT